MTIEEAIKILKEEPDFSLRYYIRENAIDVLLTAYEKQQKEIESLYKIRNIIFEFIPKTIHEVELKTKIVKSLGE